MGSRLTKQMQVFLPDKLINKSFMSLVTSTKYLEAFQKTFLNNLLQIKLQVLAANSNQQTDTE